jgi:hypothetical protein
MPMESMKSERRLLPGQSNMTPRVGIPRLGTRGVHLAVTHIGKKIAVQLGCN